MAKKNEGYKETEAGEIPKDWEMKSLGDIAAVTKLAGFEFTKYVEYRADGEVIALRALNVKGGKLNLDDIKRISKSSSDELTRSKLNKNDLLFTYVGTIGEVAIIEENDKYHLAPNVAKITIKKDVIPKYLLQYLQSDIAKLGINKRLTTTSQPALSMGNLREIEVIVPPHVEQQHIVDILSNTDEHIEKLEKIIEDYQLLKKGMMKKLLTEGIGHSEFKETEIGRFPTEWNITSLDRIGKVRSSKRVYQSDYVEAGIPFYRSKEIIELSKNVNPTVELFIDESKYNEFKNKYGAPEKGDLLITSVGTIGKVWISDGRKFYYKDGNLTQFTANDNVSIRFIYQLFNSDILKNQYLNQSYGSAQVALTIEKLNKLVVPMPRLFEQEQIADVLSGLDNRVGLYQQQREQFVLLKKALMEQLLTGKIRVNK